MKSIMYLRVDDKTVRATLVLNSTAGDNGTVGRTINQPVLEFLLG